MSRSIEGHESRHGAPRPGLFLRPATGKVSRAATTVAAVAALGLTGASAVHAQPPSEHPTATHDDPRPDGPVRTVLPGDSLWSVANANGISVDELMEFNDLSGDAALVPGDRLRLSAPEEAPESEAPQAKAEDPEDPAEHEPQALDGDSTPTTTEYTVRPGDSLWDLAQHHSVTVAAIIEANDLDLAAGLRTGQSLTIPGPGGEGPASEGQTDSVESAQTEEITNDFPGHDYDDETVEQANALFQELSERPTVSSADVQDLIRSTAKDMGVDPALALAHAEQESGFNHHVVSPASAVGTMQVLPSAGEWAEGLVGRDLDLLDPRDNVTAGVAIIRANTERADSSDEAIGAYYQGLHGVKEYGMYSDTKTYVSEVKSKKKSWS